MGRKPAQYYLGSDQQIIDRFASEGSHLFQPAKNNQRRFIQLHYLKKHRISEVPDTVQVTQVYAAEDLTASEASILLRVANVLRDDYLIPDVEAVFVEMSHGVSVLAEKKGEQLRICISRTAYFLPAVIEVCERSPEVFGYVMKDFVRNHIFQHVRQYVPSSTRGGVDTLRKTLLRNRELYRYEDFELGDLEGVLGEYLSGTKDLGEVVKRVQSRRYWYGGAEGARAKGFRASRSRLWNRLCLTLLNRSALRKTGKMENWSQALLFSAKRSRRT